MLYVKVKNSDVNFKTCKNAVFPKYVLGDTQVKNDRPGHPGGHPLHLFLKLPFSFHQGFCQSLRMVFKKEKKV
jgi:hypothetical protein